MSCLNQGTHAEGVLPYMQGIGRTIGSRATVVLTTVMLLCVLFVPIAAASPEQVSGLQLSVTPPFADSYNGWRTQASHVSLMPLESGIVMYQWDSTLGPWSEYEEPLLAPEGKHYLYACLLTESGAKTILVVEMKIDYSAPLRDVQAESPRLQATRAEGFSVSVVTDVAPWAGARVQRLGGANRYETAALISGANFDSADAVIIATGYNFADALSASGLAGCLDAPVLLTRPWGLPSEIRSEITRLGASSAVVVGGPVAIGEGVDRELRAMGLVVKRIGGQDRYETSAMIGQEVLSYGLGDGRVFIARGDGFADALALGPLAYGSRAPLLLVRPYAIPASTRALLESGAFSTGAFAGGDVAIHPDVAAAIQALVPGAQRIAGTSRYDTAGAIASYGVNGGICDWEYMGIATGVSFPDALCGGAAAGHQGGVILLTPPGTLPAPTESRIGTNAGVLRDVHLYGGIIAVSDDVWDEILLLTR